METEEFERKDSYPGTDLYNLVRKILTKENKPFDRYKVKEAIKTKIEEVDSRLYYLACVRSYLSVAAIKRDPEAREAFAEIFYDDFKETTDGGKMEIPYYAMKLVGLEDLVELDLLKNIFDSKVEFDSKVKKDSNVISWIPMQLNRIRRIYSQARNDLPLLIVGESGTSKQLLAEAIHLMGERRKEGFRDINCATIPDELFESEVFGHAKGSFTGAMIDKKGILEEADGGTVFLDEIGKTSPYAQAKWLKVIEQQVIKPIGKPIKKINIRFIGAVQPIDIEQGKLLSDLKSRFRYPVVIKVPTLSERFQESFDAFPNPVITSSLTFVLKERMKIENNIKISRETQNILMRHEYEGNFRELESILMAGVQSALDDGRGEILPGDMKEFLSEPQSAIVGGNDHINNLKSIKLKDIIVYADKLKASVVESRIEEVVKSGKDIKKVLADEGLPPEQYQNFLQKIRRIIGKPMRELRRDLK